MDRLFSFTPRDLERMLCDETSEPTALPLSLLKEITNGFSDEQQIGRGGFAVVYKGKLENRTVAVKRMDNEYMDEKEFHREVQCLMMVRHKNVVRFLGYCADRQGSMEKYEGKFIMADVHQRLLCFEYLPKGSLHEYISDMSCGLRWGDRYQIITGICQGLHYLHQKNIVHLDLKPANILLDDNWVPKISDFGISMCIHEIQSLVLTKIAGTLGYLAPESFNHTELTYRHSHRLDIYSLGVVIIEILTGKKGYHDVDKVVESWSNMLEKSQSYIQLKQVRVCAEIGIECTHFNPAKRPDTHIIIHRLDQTESMYKYNKPCVTTSYQAEENSEPVITGADISSMHPTDHHPVMERGAEAIQVDNPYAHMGDDTTPIPEFETEDDITVGHALDAYIRDMGIKNLQIIKNEDLEELRELGYDSSVTVYHGKWRGTDVAIKRINKRYFTRRSCERERLVHEFWREAGIMSKLHHPKVVAFYGVVPDGSGRTLATVTEFMVNGSVRHVLQRKDKCLDLRQRLMIALDAAFGMEYLHSRLIVHFYLKCESLLVNLTDHLHPICKIGDFGFSRDILHLGNMRQTVPWMAPELLNGSSSKVSEKVDVFSFGIILWEILTGEEPHANLHPAAILGGVVTNTLRPPVPASCDPEWRRLMEHCWSPDPAQRPAFSEIAGRLQCMLAALSGVIANSPEVELVAGKRAAATELAPRKEALEEPVPAVTGLAKAGGARRPIGSTQLQWRPAAASPLGPSRLGR